MNIFDIFHIFKGIFLLTFFVKKKHWLSNINFIILSFNIKNQIAIKTIISTQTKKLASMFEKDWVKIYE